MPRHARRLSCVTALAACAGLACAGSAGAFTPTVSTVALPGSAKPVGITTGPDGALWFTASYPSQVGRLVPGGSPTTVATLDATEAPLGTTFGPDGRLWYAEDDIGAHSQIGATDPVTGAHATYGAAVLTNRRPNHIARGPDGNLWFDETNSGAIGRITPAGTVSQFAIASSTHGVVTGPDGNVWTGTDSQSLERVTTSGVSTPFSVAPTGIVDLTTGPDGNIWATASGPSEIVQMRPDGTVLHEFPVAHKPNWITVGPDGALWFSESDFAHGYGIGRLTTDGGLTELPLAPSGGDPAIPQQLTVGPDGNIWFADVNTGRLGRVTTPPAADTGGVGIGAGGGTTAPDHADVSGAANDHAQAGSYHFEYGPTTAYGSATPDTALAPSGAPQPVSATLSGLAPDTDYHYRLVVVNGTDTTAGGDRVLHTGPSGTVAQGGQQGQDTSGNQPPRPPVRCDVAAGARQTGLTHGRLAVRTQCDAALTVRVSAALRVAAARGRHARTYGAGATPAAVRAQVSRSLTLRMSRPVRRAVLAALHAHRRVSLSLTLTATDALGRHVQATGSVRRLRAGRIG